MSSLLARLFVCLCLVGCHLLPPMPLPPRACMPGGHWPVLCLFYRYGTASVFVTVGCFCSTCSLAFAACLSLRPCVSHSVALSSLPPVVVHSPAAQPAPQYALRPLSLFRRPSSPLLQLVVCRLCGSPYRPLRCLVLLRPLLASHLSPSLACASAAFRCRLRATHLVSAHLRLRSPLACRSRGCREAPALRRSCSRRPLPIAAVVCLAVWLCR